MKQITTTVWIPFDSHWPATALDKSQRDCHLLIIKENSCFLMMLVFANYLVFHEDDGTNQSGAVMNGTYWRAFRIIGAALFVSLANASPVFAGNTYGTISPVVIQANYAVFSMSSNGTGRPGCATSQRFAFLTNSTAGQAMLSALMTAFATGKNVAIFGNNACDVWPDSETVSYLAVY